MTESEIIEHYNLAPHPEGGFYRRTYASPVTTDYGGGYRPVCTAILFLLKAGQYSRLHRIPQDEMWHFYLGDPLGLALIAPDGESREVLLGQDILAGQIGISLSQPAHGSAQRQLRVVPIPLLVVRSLRDSEWMNWNFGKERTCSPVFRLLGM